MPWRNTRQYPTLDSNSACHCVLEGSRLDPKMRLGSSGSRLGMIDRISKPIGCQMTTSVLAHNVSAHRNPPLVQVGIVGVQHILSLAGQRKGYAREGIRRPEPRKHFVEHAFRKTNIHGNSWLNYETTPLRLVSSLMCYHRLLYSDGAGFSPTRICQIQEDRSD